jgi:hypothetical protein
MIIIDLHRSAGWISMDDEHRSVQVCRTLDQHGLPISRFMATS